MKLLVDRLPKTCNDCLFIRKDRSGTYCSIINELVDDNYEKNRHIECPLKEHIHYNEILMR